MNRFMGLAMGKNKTYNKKKIFVVFVVVGLIISFLVCRLVYLMIFCSEFYGVKAEELHQRERSIKAARGEILDTNGVVLAANKTVCTISVIHSQIKDEEKVIQMLVKELSMEEADVRKRVEKVSSMEIIKKNVDKEIGDAIRNYGLAGVKVDEDFKRYYPYENLASKVLGFTGADNQGIIGLEVKYDNVLKGTDGQILSLTDARGVEIEDAKEERVEAVPGDDLILTLDYNIQTFVQQEAYRVWEEKQAESTSILVMNPQNGEILAMANAPEFDLNTPFTLQNTEVPWGTEEPTHKPQAAEEPQATGEPSTAETIAEVTATTVEPTVPTTSEAVDENKAYQDALNQMWRNNCINDTYEPGSVFKIITMAAGLSEGVVSTDEQFSCPGFKIVDDRRIHCHKRVGHGSQTFVEGAMNSCNPVFIEVGLRLGVSKFYSYFQQMGLLSKTGIDLPGEAGTIMHKQENMGQVELATVAFGQSFQITPVQLATTVSSIINGGTRITPHFGKAVKDSETGEESLLEYPTGDIGISEGVSTQIRGILEKVVSEGTGNKAAVAGFSIGGKTATSQTLPRSARQYISSFLGFAPADDPQVLVLVIIRKPQGVYYGGTIAAPVAQRIFSNILPYME